MRQFTNNFVWWSNTLQNRPSINCTMGSSVAILGRVILRWDHKTSSLTGPSVDRLQDVNHLLLVLQGPVDFVVVAGAKIDHYVLVAEEKHHCAWVVQLIPARIKNCSMRWHNKIVDDLSIFLYVFFFYESMLGWIWAGILFFQNLLSFPLPPSFTIWQ